MPERIFITYTNATAVPYQGTTLGHHALLNYIGSNGNHYTLGGLPERKFYRNVISETSRKIFEGRYRQTAQWATYNDRRGWRSEFGMGEDGALR